MRLTRIIPLVLAFALVTACSFLAPLTDELGDVVTRYCAEPIATRQAIRADVNRAAAPHAVEVRCAGDP